MNPVLMRLRHPAGCPAPGSRTPDSPFGRAARSAGQLVQGVDGDGVNGWTSPRQCVIFGAGASGWIR
jgi:hypothetical protein